MSRTHTDAPVTEGTTQPKQDQPDFTGCRFHPDRPAVVRCNKYEYSYCEECVESCDACTDPELYCQHRTQCFIWEVCRGEIKRRRRDATCAGLPPGKIEPTTDSPAHSGPKLSH